ncbi:MAG: hypothetical protein ACOYJD_04590 [Christensenellales bacterium]|jgi:preprotein translocase subunit SecF
MKKLMVIKKAKWFLAISAAVIIAGIIAAIATGGFTPGEDFAGGWEVELNLNKGEYKVSDVESAIAAAGASGSAVYSVGEARVAFVMQPVDAEKIDRVVSLLKDNYGYTNAAVSSTELVLPNGVSNVVWDGVIALAAAAAAVFVYALIRFKLSGALAVLAVAAHNLLILLSVCAIFSLPINKSIFAVLGAVLFFSVYASSAVICGIKANYGKTSADGQNLKHKAFLEATRNVVIGPAIAAVVVFALMYILGLSELKEYAVPVAVTIILGTTASALLSGFIYAGQDGGKGGGRPVAVRGGKD